MSYVRTSLLLISALAVAATLRAIWSGEWRVAVGLYAAGVGGLMLLLIAQSRLLATPEIAVAEKPRRRPTGVLPALLPAPAPEGGRKPD